jgi:hypothetical protein
MLNYSVAELRILKIIKKSAFLFDISKNNRIFVTIFNISKNAFWR